VDAQCVLSWCFRYRQQILDIESSMKQTWEEKAKLSAEYENERVKLVSLCVLLSHCGESRQHPGLVTQQLEEGKRETERLRTQFENERKRRWRLLEDKADFEQLVRELYGWEDAVSTTTGKSKAAVLLSADGGDGPVSSSTTLSPPPGADLNAWVAKFRQSVALVQVVKEKRCCFRRFTFLRRLDVVETACGLVASARLQRCTAIQ
jgi:hypothetical protein